MRSSSGGCRVSTTRLKPLFATVLLMTLSAALTGCGGSTTTDTTTDSTTSDTTTDTETSSTSENGAQTLGMSFEAEGVKHTLNSYIDNWYNPYDEYRFESADEGSKMVSINITVENIGTEVGDTSNLYYLLDFGGSEPAEMSFYGGGTQDVDTNLNRFPADNPLEMGANYTGDLLFEVSEDSTAADWTLIYNSDFLDFYDDNVVVETPLQ